MSKCPSCGFCEHCGRKDAAPPNTLGPFVPPWEISGPIWTNPYPVTWTSPFRSTTNGTYDITPH